MISKKRKREDQQAVREEKDKRNRVHQEAVCEESVVTPYGPLSHPNRTITQLVEAIGTHGRALHTISSVGSRRDDRQHEREGYNLLVLSQRQMREWCPNAHQWKPGDTDMSLLPPHVRTIYDTTGWECINFFSDGDRVVFKRPAAPIPVRGSRAQSRKVAPAPGPHITSHVTQLRDVTLMLYVHTQVAFQWSKEMLQWFHEQTHKFTFKCISFPGLVETAEQRWGHKAPEQDHMENKIRSRDKARKEGRTVKWVREALAA